MKRAALVVSILFLIGGTLLFAVSDYAEEAPSSIRQLMEGLKVRELAESIGARELAEFLRLRTVIEGEIRDILCPASAEGIDPFSIAVEVQNPGNVKSNFGVRLHSEYLEILGASTKDYCSWRTRGLRVQSKGYLCWKA